MHRRRIHVLGRVSPARIPDSLDQRDFIHTRFGNESEDRFFCRRPPDQVDVILNDGTTRCKINGLKSEVVEISLDSKKRSETSELRGVVEAFRCIAFS